MKKVASVILFVSLLFFLFVKFLKVPSSKEGADSSTVISKDLAERENIRNFWLYYRQATTYRMAREWKNAVEEYKKALAINAEHEDALYYLGNMYLELAAYREAENTWLRLYQLNSKSPRVHFQLGNLYLNYRNTAFFNVEKAEVEFRKALELNKEETGALLCLGQVALIKGKLEEAQTFFSAVSGSNFKSVPAHFLNGYIAWKKGDSKKALTLFGKAVHYSKPEKPKMGVLGEGDTQAGKSFGRLQNQSLFHTFLQGLAELNEKNIPKELETRYRKLEVFLTEI